MKPFPSKENNDRNAFYSEPKEINKSENTKNTEETQEILKLSVDLGNNQLDYLHIFKNSQPEKLAYYFCLRNNLDYEYLQILIAEIKLAIANQNSSSSSNTKALFLSDLVESPLSSPKPIDDFINAPLTTKVTHSFSNSKCSTVKKSTKTQSQLFKSFDGKSALFSTETYAQKQSKPSITKSNSKPLLKLNQSTSSKKTTLQIQLEHKHKAPSSQSKNKNPKRVFSPISTLFTPTTNHYPLNYGERLYHKGIKSQEKTKDRVSTLQKELSQPNLLTFKPSTNMISYSALSKRLINKKNYNNEQMLLGYKEYVKGKLEHLKEKHRPKENYSFSPKLNLKSMIIKNTKEKKQDTHGNQTDERYNTLYENYKSQKLNVEKLVNKIYNKDKMFKPSVNQYECAYTSMSFNERQGYFTSKSIEKQNQSKRKMEIEMNKDKETGRTYFSPEINACYQRLDNRNIFDDLYNDHDRLQQKKKALENLYNANFCSTMQNYTYANQQSEDIFKGLKERAFKAIFSVLDKDKDDMINQRNINIKTLPKTIQSIIEPIVNGLRRDDRALSEEDFVANCFRLFDMIDYTEKKELMNFIHKKKINNPNNFSFKPVINTSASCNNIKNSLTLSYNCFKSNSENSISSSNPSSHKKITTEVLPNKQEEMKFVIEEEGTQEEKNDNDDDDDEDDDYAANEEQEETKEIVYNDE